MHGYDKKCLLLTDSAYQITHLVKRSTWSKKKEPLSAVMAESTCRADQKSIYYNLRRAYDKGLLSSKRQVLSFITDISANIRRKTSGKRYSLAMKDFYSWLQIKGGPCIIKFMQDNLDGPGK